MPTRAVIQDVSSNAVIYPFSGSQLIANSVPNSALQPEVTIQGNSFNTANELVQLLPNGKLPVLDGSNLTGVVATLPTDIAVTDGPNIFTNSNTFNSSVGTSINILSGTPVSTISPLPIGVLVSTTSNSGNDNTTGQVGNFEWTPESGFGSGNIYGNRQFMRIEGTESNTCFVKALYAECTLRGSGNATEVVGILGRAGNESSIYSSGGATVGAAYAIVAQPPICSSTDQVTQAFGVKIEKQSQAGVTTAYALYQEDASDVNVLNGVTNSTNQINVSLDTGSIYPLTLESSVTGSDNTYLQFRNDSGTGVARVGYSVSNDIVKLIADGAGTGLILGNAANPNAVYLKNGTANLLINTTTDDGSSKLQVNGITAIGSNLKIATNGSFLSGFSQLIDDGGGNIYLEPKTTSNFVDIGWGSGNYNAPVRMYDVQVQHSLSIKSGTNAKAGTFTLSGGATTVANTSVTANSVIMITIKTSSGTPVTIPIVTPTAGTGFSVAGNAGDNSTYNYVILEVN